MQTKPQEAEDIADVLEMSKIQSEITTGKSYIRQGILDKINQKSQADRSRLESSSDESDNEGEKLISIKRSSTNNLRQRSKSHAALLSPG